MQTGKLSISRGHQLAEPPEPCVTQLAVVRAAPAPAAEAIAEPAAAPLASAHDRLTALERLLHLAQQGVLSAEEFAAEKALILGRPVVAPPAGVEAAIERARGPSLLGRLFSWWLVPVGLIAGLGLSWFSQPAETARFAREALRLFGL